MENVEDSRLQPTSAPDAAPAPAQRGPVHAGCAVRGRRWGKRPALLSKAEAPSARDTASQRLGAPQSHRVFHLATSCAAGPPLRRRQGVHVLGDVTARAICGISAAGCTGDSHDVGQAAGPDGQRHRHPRRRSQNGHAVARRNEPRRYSTFSAQCSR